MFEEGEIGEVVIKPLKCFEDARGGLIELVREDELAPENHSCMAYISQTLPGVCRGPREHSQQTDYFAFVGPGDFKLYLWDNRKHSATFQHRKTLLVGESNRQAVLVPPGVVRAYKAISDTPGWVFNTPNRLYAGEGRKEPIDELRHEDIESSPFQLD